MPTPQSAPDACLIRQRRRETLDYVGQLTDCIKFCSSIAGLPAVVGSGNPAHRLGSLPGTAVVPGVILRRAEQETIREQGSIRTRRH